jgi:hypothetical protein
MLVETTEATTRFGVIAIKQWQPDPSTGAIVTLVGK